MILIHTKYTFGIWMIWILFKSSKNLTNLPENFPKKFLSPQKVNCAESNQTGTGTTGRRTFFCAGEEGCIRFTISFSENEVDRENMLQVSGAFL